MSAESAQNRQGTDPEDPRNRYARLVQAARVQGQSVWLEILCDREGWNTTPEWAQDEAIKAVSQCLGESFEFRGAQVYECGSQTHRLGRFEHPRSGTLFNLIPGGRFTMGSMERNNSQPLREVLVKPFLMGATPTMQAQWDKVGGSDQRKWQGASHPIERVSWDDVQAWLTKAGDGLSLPSEAEWEYACRAGTTTAYCYGDDNRSLGAYAWFDDNSGRQTQAVAGKKLNAFGLYDVHGNVWEWCQDTWHRDYNGAPTDGSAWTSGGDASRRVLRGGCWFFDAGSCPSAFRYGHSSSYRDSCLGLRLCVRLG